MAGRKRSSPLWGHFDEPDGNFVVIIVMVIGKEMLIVMGIVHYDSDCGDCDCESIALSVHIPPRWLHKGEVQALHYTDTIVLMKKKYFFKTFFEDNFLNLVILC